MKDIPLGVGKVAKTEAETREGVHSQERLSGDGDAAVGSRHWSAIRAGAVEKHYGCGTLIFKQGEAATTVQLLERGVVKLSALDAEGNETIVALCGSGSVLGGVFGGNDDSRRPVFATALTECQVYSLAPPEFFAHLQQDARFALQVHEAQALQLHELMERLAQRDSCPARQRLSRALASLVRLLGLEVPPRNLKLALPLTQDELAAFIGVHPTYVSKLFRSLEREELIRREKGWLIILDPPRLFEGAVDG